MLSLSRAGVRKFLSPRSIAFITTSDANVTHYVVLSYPVIDLRYPKKRVWNASKSKLSSTFISFIHALYSKQVHLALESCFMARTAFLSCLWPFYAFVSNSCTHWLFNQYFAKVADSFHSLDRLFIEFSPIKSAPCFKSQDWKELPLFNSMSKLIPLSKKKYAPILTRKSFVWWAQWESPGGSTLYRF